jgi:hypothetical protein
LFPRQEIKLSNRIFNPISASAQSIVWSQRNLLTHLEVEIAKFRENKEGLSNEDLSNEDLNEIITLLEEQREELLQVLA